MEPEAQHLLDQIVTPKPVTPEMILEALKKAYEGCSNAEAAGMDKALEVVERMLDGRV